MANETNTTTEILKFEIETGDAINEQERLKAVLVNLKQESANLQKAFKAGAITLQEYASETVRVENVQKKTMDTYKKVSTSVTGVKSSFDKLNDSLKEQASSLNVAGVNVGGLSTKIAGLANPVTAAISLAGLLGSAYANSTVGAKDLEFAHNQLSSALHLTANAFAETFSSAEDGEGVVSRLASLITGSVFGIDTAVKSKLIAFNVEKLQDLERDELDIRAKIKDRLDQNADLMTKINDSQTAFNDKIALGNQIAANLKENEKEIVGIKTRQLNIVKDNLALDKNNEGIQTDVKKRTLEISAEKATIGRQLKTILTLEGNITDQNEKQVIANEKIMNKLQYQAPGTTTQTGETEEEFLQRTEGAKTEIIQDEEQNRIDFKKATAEIEVEEETKKNEAIKEQERLLFNYRQGQAAATKEMNDLARAEDVDATAYALGQTARLFRKGTELQKVLASAQAIIHTYSAAAKALDEGGGTYYGYILAAAAIAAGLADVAQINGVTFSEGGYTGPGGKFKPAGIVHAGEVVWNQRDVSIAGGPAAANAMRPTYSGSHTYSSSLANGGIVADSRTSTIDQQLAYTNSTKNLPPIEVSVVEVTKVQNRVIAKEKSTSL